MINHEDICVIDSEKMHIIFKDEKYFSYQLRKNANATTIFSNQKLIEGVGRDTIFMFKGMKLVIED